MFSDEVCPFSHEGSRKLVYNSKKVDESGTLMRSILNIGSYTRLTEPERTIRESPSHGPIAYRAFVAH